MTQDASYRARQYTDKALDRIVELIDCFDPRVALEAAKTTLDRGHGKAAQAIIAIPASRQQQAALAAMTTAELEGVIDADFTELPRLPPPAPTPEQLPDEILPMEAEDDPLLR